ncbi:MAG: AN1-like Zinc finger [Methanoregula sp. PtaU1.Bin051]|nr:MAG: AN1-like Zinc finger [Methanoregula sp. PtaU1.Bin051]
MFFHFNTLIPNNHRTNPVMAILNKIRKFFSGFFTRKKKAPVYANCAKCGEWVYLPFQCNYCNQYYCGAHRLPFNHDCEHIDDWKRRGSSGPTTEYAGGKVRVRK